VPPFGGLRAPKSPKGWHKRDFFVFASKIQFVWSRKRLLQSFFVGNVHGSPMARWKARGRLPISANWNFFASYHVEALWADIGQNCGVQKGFERKFQWEGGHQPTTLGVRKLESLGYHVALFAVLIQYRRVTDRQTDTHTHTHTHTRRRRRRRRRLIPAHR